MESFGSGQGLELGSCEHGNESLYSITGGLFSELPTDIQCLQENSATGCYNKYQQDQSVLHCVINWLVRQLVSQPGSQLFSQLVSQ